MMRVLFFLLALSSLGSLPASLAAQIAAPSEVGGLVFWVDAQDVNGNGAQPANGSTVSTWVDKSGGGNNLTTAAGTVTFEETGFDGTNPGLRFPLVARMAAANPFSGNFQDEITVFFVNANVTLTNNFSLTLNGTNQGSNIADGRFSFHTPWVNNQVYFDSGACCGSTRLQGTTPNSLTETTLYTGLNDEPGNRQWLRIDGQAFRADTTGHIANVSRGVHVGDVPSNQRYDGRFAEIVVYDRALSLAEVQQVECYLLAKWKPNAAPSGCIQPLDVAKTSQVWDPTGANLFSAPDNDVLYEIVVSKPAGVGATYESIFVVDTLPPEVSFYNGDVDDGGPESDPIAFSQTGTGLAFDYATDVKFSDSTTAPIDMTACNYTPTIDAYDPDVRYICINPAGELTGGVASDSFTVVFRAKIKLGATP